MKLIELHILQSFPVSCLNRDDVGAPKTAVFGGVNRARLSSQSLKRAIRLAAREAEPSLFQGERSRLVIEPLAKLIEECGVGRDKALPTAKSFCANLATYDEKAFSEKGVQKVKTLMFLSPLEREAIARELADAVQTSGSDKKKLEKRIGSAALKARDAKLLDAADIALFGRMVASDHSLTIEGAAMFGHALSVHKADNDIDFWTAVDDRQKEDPTVGEEDRAGSAGMGTLEFTSALYYRYCAVNLGLLADEHHLAGLSVEQRQAAMDAFIRATLTAVPGARKNSMNAHTFPSFVLGVVKEKGQPVQLINAFEEPLSTWDTKQRGGWEKAAVERLKEHHESLKKTWNVETADEVSIPESDLNSFCKTLTGHVD